MGIRRKKKVILALGAGGARGLAHIGVIQFLDGMTFTEDFLHQGMCTHEKGIPGMEERSIPGFFVSCS